MTPPRRNGSGNGRIGPKAGEFQLTVEQDGADLRLRLGGDFELSVIGRVEDTLERAMRAMTRHVVFDLRNVTFLDLAGLMTLLRANERSRDALFDVQVIPPEGLASRVFTLTRAGTELTMVDRVPERG